VSVPDSVKEKEKVSGKGVRTRFGKRETQTKGPDTFPACKQRVLTPFLHRDTFPAPDGKISTIKAILQWAATPRFLLEAKTLVDKVLAAGPMVVERRLVLDRAESLRERLEVGEWAEGSARPRPVAHCRASLRISSVPAGRDGAPDRGSGK